MNTSVPQIASCINSERWKLSSYACRLLKSCNLNELHFQLALSTPPEMTLTNMKHTKKLFTERGRVLSIFHGNGVLNPIKDEIAIESEVFYSRHRGSHCRAHRNY